MDTSTTRAVHATPSRFTSVSPNRSWNTGNGSPDAICFTVDRPNVSIIGVGLFGGGGNYTYELELLELVSFVTVNLYYSICPLYIPTLFPLES